MHNTGRAKLDESTYSNPIYNASIVITQSALQINTITDEKSARMRREHCALAVVRRSQ